MKVIKKPLCIIPAKGISKRVERKNIKLLAGKPLLSYTIEAALKSEVFSKICISSEDDKILAIAKKHDKNGEILALKRPMDLSSDDAQVKHVCKYILESFLKEGLKYSSFGVLLPTSPLRNEIDIKKAYNIFEKEDVECVMSVVSYSYPPQRAVWIKNKYIEPYFGLKYMKPTQKLDTLYRHDGGVIFCKTNSFLKNKGFYTNKILPYFIPKERAIDIDSSLEIKWAEFLLSQNIADVLHSL